MSSINSEMILPFNLEQNQANPDVETECVEFTKQKEMSNGITDNQNETLKFNSDSSTLLEQDYNNFVEPEITVFNIITEEDEISVEENPPNGNITQIDSEYLMRSESLIDEDTTTEIPVEIDQTNRLESSINSIGEPIPDIISNTITSSCDQADNDPALYLNDDILNSPNIDSNPTTKEQCACEQNEVKIENCASVSGIESNEMEIDDNEQMYPICVLVDEAPNENINSTLIDNPNVIADFPGALSNDNTTSEQCLIEENNVETEDCAFASHLESNEMEIDDNEQMYPICVLVDQSTDEDINYSLIDNQNVIPELPVALHDELLQSDELPIGQKRSLRKIFQCKICKLTFSSSERLNFHNKSHDDDDDDESDESHQSTNSVTNGSSSGSESDQDSNSIVNKTSNHYAQCSKCTKFFMKGNDINQHMKTIHPDKTIDDDENTSANNEDENNSSTLSDSVSKPTLLNSETSLCPNTKPLNLLETLLRLRFKCDLCQLTFSTALRLEEHIKSHNDHDQSDHVENVSFVKHEGKPHNDISDKDQQSDSSMSSVNEFSESSYFDSSGTSSSEHDENSESELELKPSVSQKPRAKEKQIIPRAKYQCQICNLRFATKTILQYHQKKHIINKTRASTSTKDRTNERNKLQCPHCPKRFPNQHRKVVHIWKHHTTHNNSPYFEDVVIMDNFTINDVIHKENAKYPCQVDNCEHKFLTQETLNDHSKLHAQFSCKFCTEKFKFAPELALHEAKNHEDYTDDGKETRFKCPRCSFKPHDQNQYVNHFLQTHFNLLMDICRCLICKAPLYAAEIKLPLNMLGHHLTHHEISNAKSPVEIYRCGDCPAYFITPFQLSKHKLAFHLGGVKKHACADCGNKFLLPLQLRQHRINMHKDVIGELQYSCEVEGCEKRFETKYELDSHNMHRHSGKDPFLICAECGKRFGGKSAFQKHKQVHNADLQEKRKKEKTLGFVCEHCGKKFLKKDQLEVHYKSHSGPESWDFCCEICSKKCLTGGKLKEHMRVHSKEKPFVCELCGQKYAHRHNW